MTAATFQGNPCKRGHSGLRYRKSGSCVACQLEFSKARAPVGVRKRRTLELIAIVSHGHEDAARVTVAVTISSANGFQREEFQCDETPQGLIAAIRDVADWLERDFVEVQKLAEAG